MKTNAEKRVYDRHSFAADVEFSYFNKEHLYLAQTLNIGMGGMCFKSSRFLKPGATVYVRLQKIHPNGSGSGACEGLRSATLAEVRWCKEVNNETESFYVIGAKYYEPVY